MIRAATLDDCRAMAVLGKRFHEQAGWSDITEYSVDDCAASLSQFMQVGAFLGFVSDNGSINGMIGGVVSPVYFNHAHKSGEELFWWVDDRAPQATGMRLLTALEREAKAMGLLSWQMKTLAKLNDDRMPAVMERLGYRASERSWIKRL